MPSDEKMSTITVQLTEEERRLKRRTAKYIIENKQMEIEICKDIRKYKTNTILNIIEKKLK